ncbi:tautomerase family protein [Streptomyces sp. NRRL S-920]|nr:tautomerase family protein [Streptomyces sp. NRRL S-920]
MPMIRVQMFPGRTADQKEALVKEVTEAIQGRPHHCGVVVG